MVIGISWHTKSNLLTVQNRTIPLAQIARAERQVGQLAIWSGRSRHRPVVKGFWIEIIRVTEIDNKNDIDGLVALVMACDKVISIDNSKIHLAGALGRETHVLLPRQCDWRWG